MLYTIQQTRDEKIVMYMKLTKREIIEMLLNNQEALERFVSTSHSIIEGCEFKDARNESIKWE